MTPCNPHAVYTGGSFLYSKGGVKEMKLEEKLTSLRKEKGLTQLELAEAVHVSRQAVSRWEVGTAIPTTENLAALSQLYGVTVDDLLNDREELPAPQKEPPPAEAGKGRWLAVALAALSLAVLILAVCVGALLLSQREDAHDLSDLTREEGIIPDSTFSLEWP